MSTVRLTHAACSLVLSYPDEELVSRLPVLRSAVPPGGFAELLSYLEQTPLPTVAEHYVSTFDLRRKCCLYLTYYTHGDTRGRGQALLLFRERYRAAGLRVTDEELPDHLAIVLEYSAAGHTREAVELLAAHRPGLELLCRALRDLDSPYVHAVAAVLATLPGHADARTVQLLAEQGPPTETVGVR